ncbi:MAG: hypothetical protein JWN11_1786 [Hyphomicrobiales bacterium]|nr:hypothetical protein [Hyphomicrobiales bacterium]
MDERNIDLRELIGLLRREAVAIALTFLGVAGSAVLLALLLQPAYTATTLVLVDPSHKDLLSPDGQNLGFPSDSPRVDSEVELVKARSTLLSVVNDANLIHDSEIGPQAGLLDKLLAWLHVMQPARPGGEDPWNGVVDRLADAISVQRRGTTFLVEISAKSASPEFAAKLANAVADSYIRDQRDAKIASVLSSRDIIQSRLADAVAAVAKSEAATDDFIAVNLDRMSAGIGRNDLGDVQKQLEALASGQQALQARADAAADQLGRRDWPGVAASLKSQAISTLEQQRATIAGGLNASPSGTLQATGLRAELAGVEASLGTIANATLASLRQQISDGRTQASDLRAQLRARVVTGDLPVEQLTVLYEMQQNSQIARTQYQTLIARQKDLEAQAYVQVADSRVVSPATVPTAPSSPNVRLILVLGGIAGLVLGVAISVVRENLIGGFSSAAQAESVLRLPVAGSIPRQKRARAGEGSEATLASFLIDAPLSSFSESIRRILVGIDQSLRRQRRPNNDAAPAKGAVVMVSSAGPDEGKTTVALSMARALAGSGRSTLLIDCDLRRPSLHRHLGLEPSSGLLDYLRPGARSTEIGDILADDPESGARVIVGSRRSETPTDSLLTGQSFHGLLTAARDHFDVIILDTPPVGPVVDGIYLAEGADVIVFVLKWASTTQIDAKAAIAALGESKAEAAEILTVINQHQYARPQRHAAYHRYYEEP